MKAIETKFLGPTNNRGSRVKAFDCHGNHRTLSWDSSLDSMQNHVNAAKALAAHVCPDLVYVGVAELKDTYVHVLAFKGSVSNREE